jgi:hypothetical protein
MDALPLIPVSIITNASPKEIDETAPHLTRRYEADTPAGHVRIPTV